MTGSKINISTWIGSLLAVTTLFACKEKGTENDAPEPVLLAEVFNYKLHYDDIDDLIQGYENEQDSLQQLRSITEHWVRDRLILVEAEKKFPKDVNMNQLLEDYRQSLLRHFFEQQVIAQQLDTVISEEDLLAYYEKNKDQHRLESGIWRGYFFKIKKPIGRTDRILTWWRTFPQSHYQDVITYGERHAKTNWSDTTQWHELNVLVQLFPEGTLSESQVRSTRSILREDSEFVYLVYPVEVFYQQDIAPLDRIRDQAARYIIHQRELELLDRIKEEIYERDIQHERVNIFINK